MSSIKHLTGPAYLGLLLAACGPATDETAEPRLVEVGVVVLDEGPTGGLAGAMGFTQDPQGHFYVTEPGAGVVEFGADGRFIRKYGRTGDGPGEYRMPFSPMVPDDSTLLVVDVMRQSLSAFDRRDGAFRERREGTGGITSMISDGSAILLGVLHPDLSMVVRRTKAVADTGLVVLPVPMAPRDVLQRAGMLLTTLWARNDSMLVGSAVSNLLALAINDRVVDTLELPRVRRRGVPADLGERLAAADFRQRPELFSSQFTIVNLGRRLGVIHFELSRVEGETEDVRMQYTFASWLTVLNEDLTMACPDLRIPISTQFYPFVTSRGDTLLAIDQHDVGDDIRLVIRKFVAEVEGCAWMPVGRAGTRN